MCCVYRLGLGQLQKSKCVEQGKNASLKTVSTHMFLLDRKQLVVDVQCQICIQSGTLCTDPTYSLEFTIVHRTDNKPILK